MAQQFQVLRCCSCHVFQVQQVKKSKKWNCKICDEKQSILKVFGEGSGADCRHHVQKLNLLQGEVEQAPANLLGCIEEPIERGDENIVLNLEEELGWQEKRVDLVSRWTKYLDERCEEQEKEDTEEVMVPTEKQTYSSKRNMVAHSRFVPARKYKKARLYTSNDCRSEERRDSGFAKDVQNFENRINSVTVDIKNCGEATCESVLIPADEEYAVHRENKDPGSRGAGFSKWEKFLLPGKSCNNDATTVVTQEEQGALAQTPVAGASDKRAATTINCNWDHTSQQNGSTPFYSVQQDSTIDHIAVASVSMGRSRHAAALVSAHYLQERLPEQPASIASARPLTISNSKNLYRNLFSTGDDFDDYI
ncbi:MRN complex-interacting protein [Elgaria multicarinata webbii]|uniref:MRN complex-interacting protein n=1 Tax=Elgaria multicarinata webbii TaxID=159646 RepID=UPI002FCCD8D0